MLPNELLKHLPDAHKDLLFWFYRLCWKTGLTPETWKSSNTILFHKKGSVTDPANYRPIALHLTLYKLWTSIITAVMQPYAEEAGMLSSMQEGFRKNRNCGRQLQHLVSILEDAKLTGRNLFLLQVDFASAFNSVDHPRLFHIMEQLGMPADAIAVVKGVGLYTGVTTRIQSSAGSTADIPVCRGTIQGDTLSPFLFLMFIEPLLRWLEVGGRGYRCGSLPPNHPRSDAALAYADDLNILCDAVDQVLVQINEIEAFCAWSGMQLAPHKCNLTGILHGAVPHATKDPQDWALLEPMLARVTINGDPVRLVPPDAPFKYLGVLLTLNLDWSHQFRSAKSLIEDRSQRLLECPLLFQQKVLAEEQSIMSALRYGFCLAPFSPNQLRALDAARARLYKALLNLPTSASTDMMFMPHDQHGLGYQSLVPIYVQTAAETLVECLNDKGALGDITRALRDQHLKRLQGDTSLTNPEECWMTSRPAAMCQRKAAWVHKYDLTLDCPAFPPTLGALSSDLREVVADCIRLHNLPIAHSAVYDHVILPLSRAGITQLHQVRETVHLPESPTPRDTLITWTPLQAANPAADVYARHALEHLRTIFCSPETLAARLRAEGTPPADALNLSARNFMNTGLTRTLPAALAARGAAGPAMAATERHPHAGPATCVRSPQRFPARLARLVQADTVAPSPAHPAAPLSPLCNVTWRDSWFLSAKDRAYLVRMLGMSVRTELCASDARHDETDLPLWSHIAWEPSTECATHVAAIWPLQHWCSQPADGQDHLVCRYDAMHDARHAAQGLDARASLLAIPKTVVDKHGLTLSTTEINPDQDTTALGHVQLLLNAPGDMMGAYNASGHFAGQVTLQRLYELQQRRRATLLRPHAAAPAPPSELTITNTSMLPALPTFPPGVTAGDCQLEPGTAGFPSAAPLMDATMIVPAGMPDAVFSLLASRGVHRASVAARTKQVRWQPTHHLTLALRSLVPFECDWFTCALSVAPASVCPTFASRFEQDAGFGALIDAFKYRWTGHGLINPPGAHANKALRWALQSTTEPVPVLHMAIVPRPRKKALQQLMNTGRVHVLSHIATKTVQGHSPDFWLNLPPDPYRNHCELSLMLIYNQAGLCRVNRPALQDVKAALCTAGARLLDWDGDVPAEIGGRPPPKLSATFKAAKYPLAQPAPISAQGPSPGAQELASLYGAWARHTPDKRYTQATCIYTDGSKTDTSITGLVFVDNAHCQAFKIEGHDAELNTVLRAELAAISRAIDQLNATKPRSYPTPTAYILTDSLTSIFLITRAIENPESLRYHKHRNLVFYILQQLLASPFQLHVAKVRAHTGVLGNEAADRLASRAHEDGATADCFDIFGQAGRGQHWIRCPGPSEGHLYNAADLKDQLVAVVRKSQTRQILETPTDSVLRKTKHLLTMHGGLAAQVSAYIWTNSILTPVERSLAAQFWTNRVWTLDKQQKLLGTSAVPDAICPHCRQGVETADHAANKCHLPQVIHQVKLRHDEALYRILPTIVASCSDTCTITCDARNIPPARRAKLTEVAWGGKLPDWVLPLNQQHSYPDICVIDTRRSLPDGRVNLGAKRQASVHILELKYAPDLELHGDVRTEALLQHNQLRNALLHAGWGTVRIHPVIIGNAGTISSETMAALTALGIPATARLAVMKRLAIDSIRRTANIKRERLGHAANPTDAHEPEHAGDTAEPDADAEPPVGPPPVQPIGLGARQRNSADSQAGEAPSPQSPNSTLSSACHDAAVVQQQNVASTSAPPSVHEWHVVTRSKRRATSLHTGPSHERAQPQACSQEHDRDPKRQRGAYAILAMLPEDALIEPPPVGERGRKRNRLCGDRAAAPTLPSDAEPASHVRRPSQGSLSSPAMTHVPGTSEIAVNADTQPFVPTLSDRPVRGNGPRRKQARMLDAADVSASRFTQRQPRLQQGKRNRIHHRHSRH